LGDWVIGPLLEIENLQLVIRQPGAVVSVLHGVKLTVDRGEVVALVGETGSGKTLTALSTLRLLPPGAQITAGQVRLAGLDMVTATDQQVQAVRGRQIGVIFQQARAALNPTRPVVQQVADRYVDLLGLTRRVALVRAIDLLGQVGLPEPAVRGYHYPHQLSGGMCQRVMIALAIAASPQLLLADEPTTGLDVTLQAQILKLLTDLVQQQGVGVLLITHDLAVVAQAAQRLYVMYAGEVVESGPTQPVLQAPQHPYTQGLVNAVRSLEAGERPVAIPGLAPRFHQPPTFCPFVSRCPAAFDRCQQERPLLQSNGEGRGVACHLYDNANGKGCAHA
jgi:oligopeptide/dipeptide ABC transporter ATP-binding protein